MGAVISNLDEVMAAAMKSIDALEGRIKVNIKRLMLEADMTLKALTPVNTGQSVRNYIWTEGAAFEGVYEAIDNGEPGPTNSMALGQEPRRGINETAALESLLELDLTNPFQTFYCTNNAPQIQGLELGLLPGPPLRSRSPGGMFKITETTLAAKLAVKGIFS